MKKSLTSLVVIFSCSKSGTPGADRNGALGGDGIDGGWCFGVADGHAGGVRAQARSGVSRWRAGRGRTMGDAMPGPRTERVAAVFCSCSFRLQRARILQVLG